MVLLLNNHRSPFRVRASLPRRLLVAGALLASASAVSAQQTAPPAATDRTVEERIARYERPERREWLKPAEVLEALEVREGQVVADIGAGSGLLSRPLARAVGPRGKVYAVDIDAEILRYLRDRARKESLRNLEVVVSREDDPLLPARTLDLAFFCDTIHHVANRVAFYRKVKEALKDGGRLAIIDFAPDARAKGFCPHPPEELVPVWQVVKEADEAGFALVKVFTFLPRNYFLVFQKQP